MDLIKMYKYAWIGVNDYIETLEKLHQMCLDENDGDAAEEYEMKLEIVKEDKEFIAKVWFTILKTLDR